MSTSFVLGTIDEGELISGKIKIELSKNGRDCKIYLDGKPLTSVTSLAITASADGLTKFCLEMVKEE